MLYGSLYKVFLKLSNPKNAKKKNFNELTIPKIFVKILLNKEKKNLNQFSRKNSNELIQNHHVFDFNSDKKVIIRKNKNKSLIKNNYLTNNGFSLPKIKITNDIPLNIPLFEKNENSESKSKIKKDFLMSESFKQIKNGNESSSLDFSKKIYDNQNNNIRKIKIQKIDESNKNNDFSSYLENKIIENENEKYYEGEIKDYFSENIMKLSIIVKI